MARVCLKKVGLQTPAFLRLFHLLPEARCDFNTMITTGGHYRAHTSPLNQGLNMLCSSAASPRDPLLFLEGENAGVALRVQLKPG